MHVADFRHPGWPAGPTPGRTNVPQLGSVRSVALPISFGTSPGIAMATRSSPVSFRRPLPPTIAQSSTLCSAPSPTWSTIRSWPPGGRGCQAASSGTYSAGTGSCPDEFREIGRVSATTFSSTTSRAACRERRIRRYGPEMGPITVNAWSAIGPCRSASTPPLAYLVGRRTNPSAGTSKDSVGSPIVSGQDHFSSNPSTTSTLMGSPSAGGSEARAGTHHMAEANHKTTLFDMATLMSDSRQRPGGWRGDFQG